MATQLFFRTEYANVQGNLTSFGSPANPGGAQTGLVDPSRIITQQLATTRGSTQTNITTSTTNGPIRGTGGCPVYKSLGRSAPVVWWITIPSTQM